MVVRDESGNVLDVNSTSTTQLYEHHINAVDRIKKANVSLEKRFQSSIDFVNNYLIFFCLCRRIPIIKIEYPKR